LEVVVRRVAAAIERSNSNQRVVADRERLAAFSHQLFEVQEIDRGHLARELHDEIGQVLTLASISLHEVKALASAAARARLEECCRTVDNALEQVRSLTLKLRPPLLDELGLEAALGWHLHRLAGQAGLIAHFDCPPSLGRFHPNIETACYRVIQEALTNVVRHARASEIWVKLQIRDAALEMSVRDDGIGFNVQTRRQRAARGESFGLVSMEQRVLLAGGTIEFESAALCGSVVYACLPVAATPAASIPAGECP